VTAASGTTYMSRASFSGQRRYHVAGAGRKAPLPAERVDVFGRLPAHHAAGKADAIYPRWLESRAMAPSRRRHGLQRSGVHVLGPSAGVTVSRSSTPAALAVARLPGAKPGPVCSCSVHHCI